MDFPRCPKDLFMSLFWYILPRNLRNYHYDSIAFLHESQLWCFMKLIILWSILILYEIIYKLNLVVTTFSEYCGFVIHNHIYWDFQVYIHLKIQGKFHLFENKLLSSQRFQLYSQKVFRYNDKKKKLRKVLIIGHNSKVQVQKDNNIFLMSLGSYNNYVSLLINCRDFQIETWPFKMQYSKIIMGKNQIFKNLLGRKLLVAFKLR